MIAIVNVSTHDDLAGENDYELRFNSTVLVLVTFKHERRKGLPDCLRAAADAYEKDPDDDWIAPEEKP